MTAGSLETLVARYALEKDIEPATAAWLKTVVRRYGAHLNRAATIEDLNDDAVNAWLAALMAQGKSRTTVKGYRGGLVMLWRLLSKAGEADAPKRLRTVKAPKPIPCAWTLGEVARLLAQAQGMGGYYRCGTHRGAYWEAMVLVLWESALRIGDVLKLRWEDISENGVVVVRQKKTHWPHVFRLSEKCLAAVERIRRPNEEVIFGGIVSRDWVFVTMKKISTAAGLRGGTKKIRKSAATAVERIQPGAATILLGHKTGTMARDYYVDPRLVALDRPTPPPLDEAG